MTKKAGSVNRILNCIPSPQVENDWTYENATEAGVLAAPTPLPPKVDLRESWWKIGNQESTGSCVGWATADSVLRWHFVKANCLNPDELLSVRFIWMAAKETDEFISQPTTFIERVGTSLKAALDIARKFGVAKDRVLPFKSYKLYSGDAKTFYAMAAQLKIASYFNLGKDLRKWREWLAFQGPILTRLDVDDTWYNAKNTFGNLDVYQTPPEPAGHAVALVGYTQDRFIVRNSWGDQDWGDAGFGYASFAYAQAAFTEAYGVTV